MVLSIVPCHGDWVSRDGTVAGLISGEFADDYWSHGERAGKGNSMRTLITIGSAPLCPARPCPPRQPDGCGQAARGQLTVRTARLKGGGQHFL
jgi:hypothetical protein